jgi:putative transposase
MRRTKTEIYLHLVWATRLRVPQLDEDLWTLVRVVADREAQALGCTVMAMNGTEDHAHLLVRVPGRVSAAQLAKQVKGASSHAINERLPDGDGFRWQEGYGAFSISRSHLRRVTAYVTEQRERHRLGTVWPEWEETDEEAP